MHTFVERKGYTGPFLPGYKDMTHVKDPLASATYVVAKKVCGSYCN